MINYMMYFMLFLACLGRKLNAKLKGHMNFDFFSYTLKTLKEIREIVCVRMMILLF